MDGKYVLTDAMVDKLAQTLKTGAKLTRFEHMYAEPRGGVHALYALVSRLDNKVWIERSVASKATLIVDDILDTGETLRPYLEAGATVAVLLARPRGLAALAEYVRSGRVFYGGTVGTMDENPWVVFPWEQDADEANGPVRAVRQLLMYMGLDPDAPGLKETPRRVLDWFASFRLGQPEPTITTFGEETYSGMLVQSGLPFVSLCEHHLLPFVGSATVGYVPDFATVESHKVMGYRPAIGLSKLARIVEYEARRATLQERLTDAIFDRIQKATGSAHVAVVLRGEHMCMSLRGPRVPNHNTVTSRLSGAFEDGVTRAEFMHLAHGN